MKTKDMLLLCLQNLMRRKSRTLLTVLGVVIGCCAIIIMVSIGIGTNESQEVMLAQMGDLTVINVYSYGRSDNTTKLDKATLDQMRMIKGVELVTPQANLTVSFNLYAGRTRRYQAQWTSIQGMASGATEKLEYPLLSGRYPEAPNEILVGEYCAYNFMDSKRPERVNMVDRYSGGFDENWNPINVPDPFFDITKEPLTLVVDTGEGNKPITVDLKVVGVMKEDYSKSWLTSEGIIMNVDDVERINSEYKKITKSKEKDEGYNQVIVKTTDIKLVEDVETEIKGMGFETSSMESIRKPMQEEARQKQLMLGGLGAISLFVAAIGITNTMIMSISERTREIGVMKALGCFLGDIRKMFLLEAGCIGLMGGIVGIVLSEIISVVMNIVSASAKAPITDFAGVISALTTKGARISVVPLWLIAFALIFSVCIGLGSGYHPANKAVKVSALEAIKHEG